MSALDEQIGGEHYKGLAIQPMEYSMKNNLNACQHTAIKYITRYRDKGDPLENLRKAIHTIELLIEIENLDESKKIDELMETAPEENGVKIVHVEQPELNF